MLRSALMAVLLAVFSVITAAATSHAAEKRVALVIGNATYTGIAALQKPVRDAQKVAETLRGMGFTVILRTNANKTELDAAAHEFSQAVKGAEVGFFYYSGHGFQSSQATQQHPVNHIVPIDFTVDAADALHSTLALDVVLNTLKREARVGFVFMDACRSDPRLAAAEQRLASGTRAVTIARGFSPVSPALEHAPVAKLSARKGPIGLMIAYATDPGNVAYEGDKGPLSPFTTALVKHLIAPGLSIAEAMGRVSAEVATETQGQQTPWSVSSLTAGTYQFIPKAALSSETTQSTPNRSNSSPAPPRPTGASSTPSRPASAPARNNLPPNLGAGVGAGL